MGSDGRAETTLIEIKKDPSLADKARNTGIAYSNTLLTPVLKNALFSLLLFKKK
jgi:hypothetical protein